MDKDNGTIRKRGKSRGLSHRHTIIPDWTGANTDALVRAIERAAFTGGALRFGYSRDGGAYAIGIYGDGEPYTVYSPAGDDLVDWLTDIADLFDVIADDQASARRGKKTPPQDDVTQ